MRAGFAALLVGLSCLHVGYPARAQSELRGRHAQSELRALAELRAAVPAEVSEFQPARIERLRRVLANLDVWADQQLWSTDPVHPDAVLQAVRRLVAAMQQLDAARQQLLSLRTHFASLPAGAERALLLRQYLLAVTQLGDFSGRLRYRMRDVIDEAAFDLDEHHAHFRQLIADLTAARLGAGAAAMSYALLDPPADSGAFPYPAPIKLSVLELIDAARSPESMGDLTEFVRQPSTVDELLLRAAEVMHRIGLPQEPRPGQDPRLPPPPITARELASLLQSKLTAAYREAQGPRVEAIEAWLAQRSARGILSEVFRYGDYELRAGDWLLMRGTSPYNRFTDLRPGLFTHVGVVAVEVGEDGIRRFLIVDLPERGDRIPAATLDAYLQPILHFYFVRHEDPAVGAQMGELARRLIGHPSQFDLQFDMSRVQAARGRLDQLEAVNTYCAGFLLLLSQETDRPLSDFFPILERPASARLLENLDKLGLSLGDPFVSPTGAIFSPHLQIVAQREPVYSPSDEIRDAVFDHFAGRMIQNELTPDPDLYQKLRQQFAGIAGQNPWLAQALARLNNVSDRIDLESAAKAAAIVEVLQAVAENSVQGFEAARGAFFAPPEAGEEVAALRQLHADAWQAWERGQLSPRELRMELVRFYSRQGQKNLDQRLFPHAPKSSPRLF